MVKLFQAQVIIKGTHEGLGHWRGSVLPPFDEHGNLPAGIHGCTTEELAARFGSGSEERLTELSELLEFIAAAQRAGVRRLLVRGCLERPGSCKTAA
jgi:hypothetical protein